MGVATPTLTEYAIGGRVPARTVAARDADAVVAAVLDANARAEAVIPFGGRTRIEVGNAPARYDVALDLRCLGGIVEHEPADLTATVRSGTTVGDLGAHLARHGQMWPPAEVARPGLATVGGVLASAAPGPYRLRYAHPRDWLVGLRAVLGDGRLVQSGGKVVKNVTGYDLTRTLCGTYGTLAVVVEASLKLWPVPEAERTLVGRFSDARAAATALDELRRAGVLVDAAVLLDRDGAAFLGEDKALAAVRLRGPRAAVERLASHVARALRQGHPEDAPARTWEGVADVPLRAEVALRVGAPEVRIDQLLGEAGPGVLRYHGAGIAYLVRESADAAWIRALRERIERAEGSLVMERAPRAARAAVEAWGAPAMPHELMRRIKAALDPNAVLSPGRFAGGI